MNVAPSFVNGSSLVPPDPDASARPEVAITTLRISPRFLMAPSTMSTRAVPRAVFITDGASMPRPARLSLPESRPLMVPGLPQSAAAAAVSTPESAAFNLKSGTAASVNASDPS